MRETAPRMLSEKISKRTGIQLKSAANWPKQNSARIALILATDTATQGVVIPKNTATERPNLKTEGFRVVSKKNGCRYNTLDY